MENKPPVYLQTDNRWANIDYSAKGEKTTIGKAGCGPTACAMAISALKDSSNQVFPPDVASWMLKNGYKALNQGTYYSGIVAAMNHWGIPCNQITSASVYHSLGNIAHERALNALKNGNMVIACMGKGLWTSSGHFVLAWKVDNTKVYINDPNSLKDMRMCNVIRTWQYEVKHYFVIDVNSYKKTNKDIDYAIYDNSTEDNKKDDDVIDDKVINVFGNDLAIPTIFKNDYNFVQLKEICKAIGLNCEYINKKPTVKMNEIKVKIGDDVHSLQGINTNGTIFLPIRKIANLLGVSIDWKDRTVIINKDE